MELFIKLLIKNFASDIGKYTYVRIVKVMAKNISTQFGVSPGFLGKDLTNIASGASLSSLSADDAEAVQSLTNVILGFLSAQNITLTMEDLKPLLAIWGPRLTADFPVS